MAILLNILLLIMEAIALYHCIKGKRLRIWVFYTQLSNLAATISAALLLLAGQKAWVASLRYLSVCMLIMTFFVSCCVLVPMGGNAKTLLFSGSGLYHHTLCPAVCVISYVFFERHAGGRALLLPVLVTLGYGLLMLYMNWTGKVDGPYPFFRVRNQSVRATIFWFAVLFCVTLAIAAVVMRIAP